MMTFLGADEYMYVTSPYSSQHGKRSSLYAGKALSAGIPAPLTADPAESAFPAYSEDLLP